ncbi:unnamed protein product [Penicillium roqueforti FM164]|uniref:Protein kinase-like domain n=1 Tax=Penicillium roqueforti (strain FM164) TaxID=1365484 RepID=W6QP68_PENRF|nr:unnamed protein product [Penicillium roqueforti FM164]
MIMKSDSDLTTVRVVDLEWVYAGPAQLFGSAPWWLLHDRPVNDEWKIENSDHAPVATEHYFDCLRIFNEALVKEEEKRPKSQYKELSEHVKWSETSGAIWVHMLLFSGFFNPLGFPYMKWRQFIGFEWWMKRVSELQIRPEVKDFVCDKLRDLDEYDKGRKGRGTQGLSRSWSDDEG